MRGEKRHSQAHAHDEPEGVRDPTEQGQRIKQGQERQRYTRRPSISTIPPFMFRYGPSEKTKKMMASHTHGPKAR